MRWRSRSRSDLHEGFIDPELKLALYTDHQIFERYHRFRLKEGFRKNAQALTLKELTQLKPGDLVVHIDHGVGVFSGLEKIDAGGSMQEAIRLIYRDNDILYVGIHSLHRVSKFSGEESGAAPKVSKLGSPAWKNLKERTKAKVKRCLRPDQALRTTQKQAGLRVHARQLPPE